MSTLKVFTAAALGVVIGLGWGYHAFAEDAVCVFLSDRDNAWVVRKDAAGVKTSLKVGDPIYMGDTVMTTRGNTVQLAFDKEAQNMVQIEGDTTLQISRINPTDLELKSGKIYALLDKKGPESKFKVYAPTAIAAVRGTQFQVAAQGNVSKVLTFRGEVAVTGRDTSGAPIGEPVILGPGQKTQTDMAGQTPIPAEALDVSEQAEFGYALGRADQTKGMIQNDEIKGWFQSSTKTVAESSQAQTTQSESTQDDADSSAKSSGAIVL